MWWRPPPREIHIDEESPNYFVVKINGNPIKSFLSKGEAKAFVKGIWYAFETSDTD